MSPNQSICSALFAGLFAFAAVPACASANTGAAHPAIQFSAGIYRCDANQRIHVRHVAPDRQLAVVHWNRRDYTLRAVPTQTGALRFEDPASGLTWISIVEKSMLLDTKNGKQLANECRV